VTHPSKSESVPDSRLIAESHGGAYSTFRNTRHFGCLDGLRSISILAVIWHHGPGAGMSGLGSRGWLGVHLFFAISGFLITTLLLREKSRKGEIELKKFYVRRVLRIFPLYYSVLALYAVIVFITNNPGRELFYAALPAFLTYTSNWFFAEDVVVFGFAWSLATEEQFYCTWPWVEQYLTSRWALVLMFLVAVAITGWQVWHPGIGLSAPLYQRILVDLAPAILWGVLLAHLLHERTGHAIAMRLFGYRWSSAFALVFVLLLIAAGSPSWLIYLAMVWLVGSCVVREDHWLAPIFSVKLFVQIGVVSYGMYMFHSLVYDVLHRVEAVSGMRSFRGGLTEFVLCTSITLVVASLSYRYYESRFLKLKDRYAS
jgi:peptidoglycan/LPS O-acetylase OafA/YrhL